MLREKGKMIVTFLRAYTFVALLSLFCHYRPSKTGETEGNQVKLKMPQALGRPEDLVNFVRLAGMAQKAFQDRRVNYNGLSFTTEVGKPKEVRRMSAA